MFRAVGGFYRVSREGLGFTEFRISGMGFGDLGVQGFSESVSRMRQVDLRVILRVSVLG